MHIRATANTGATQDDICEALLHVAIYAGVPAANHAIKLAKQVYRDSWKPKRQRDGRRTMSNRKPETGAFFQRDRQWHPPAYTPDYKTSVVRSPQQCTAFIRQHACRRSPARYSAIPFLASSTMISSTILPSRAKAPSVSASSSMGSVVDERGKGVAGALLEFWQANAGGRYRHKREGYLAALDPNFGGMRPYDHRRGRPLPVPHGQAGRLPLAERRQ